MSSPQLDAPLLSPRDRAAELLLYAAERRGRVIDRASLRLFLHIIDLVDDDSLVELYTAVVGETPGRNRVLVLNVNRREEEEVPLRSH